MTWEQLQQLIAEAGEGWRLYPGAEGVWVLDRPDIQQNILFRTPEELIAYLRQYARTGDQAPPEVPTPKPIPRPPGGPIPAPPVPTPRPSPRPPGGPLYPPEKPADWDSLMPGHDWQYMWEPVIDTRELIVGPEGKGIDNPNYKKAIDYKPSSRYTSWWAIYVKAKTPAPTQGPPMPDEPAAGGYEWYQDPNPPYGWTQRRTTAPKAKPYPEGVRYSDPDRFGNIYYRSSDDEPWKLLTKQNQTVDQALYEAITKGDQKEIDRLIAIRDQIDNTPAFRASEEQRAIENQRALRQEAVEAEQLALQRARSPGDWLTWWSMMNRANQPTAEEFQRFGAERFAPGMAGVFQPQVAQAGAVPAPQQQMMFAPAQNVGYGQPQFQAAQKAVQDEIEKRYNQWLNSLDARMYEDLDEPTKARVRAEIEAQVKKEFPLPETFTGFGATGGGYGTTNRAIYEEYQRRMAAGEPLNQEMIFRGQAPAPEKMPYTGQAPSVETMPYLTPEQRAILDAIPLAGTPETLARAASDREAYMEAFRRQPATRAGTTPAARGGLDWLNVLRSGQPIPEPRLAANIPGVPAYPNPQTWANLLPSQKEAYKASVEMQGIPFADYWKQYQEQIPKGYVPPGYMFQRQPSYIRR